MSPEPKTGCQPRGRERIWSLRCICALVGRLSNGLINEQTYNEQVCVKVNIYDEITCQSYYD